MDPHSSLYLIPSRGGLGQFPCLLLYSFSPYLSPNGGLGSLGFRADKAPGPDQKQTSQQISTGDKGPGSHELASGRR